MNVHIKILFYTIIFFVQLMVVGCLDFLWPASLSIRIISFVVLMVLMVKMLQEMSQAKQGTAIKFDRYYFKFIIYSVAFTSAIAAFAYVYFDFFYTAKMIWLNSLSTSGLTNEVLIHYKIDIWISICASIFLTISIAGIIYEIKQLNRAKKGSPEY